jgi:hypothetical protein
MPDTVSRSAPCPCGSGKKYKNCCFEKDARARGVRKKKSTVLIAGGVALGLVIVFGGLAAYIGTLPGPYDDLAKCLTEKGYKMYGASWCTHCAEQKALFGKSFQYIDYVECAEPDGDGVIQACKDAGVEKLPTWVMPGNEKVEGMLSVSDLAMRSTCALSADAP